MIKNRITRERDIYGSARFFIVMARKRRKLICFSGFAEVFI